MAGIYTRRQLLSQSACGFGSLALTGLLHENVPRSFAADSNDSPSIGKPHFRPTARRVIFLFMGGGPSQVDTWDPKPLLNELHGKSVPESIAKDIPRIARSPLLVEGRDFSLGIYGADGTLLEQTEYIPVLGYATTPGVRAIARTFGSERSNPSLSPGA